MNKKILLIAQSSSSIQLIREFFSLGYIPCQIVVITEDSEYNSSFINFVDYYGIKRCFALKNDFNEVLLNCLKDKFDLVISFSNPFIISEIALSKSVFLNFHPGWLPKYRGSLSTVYSLINNEKFVGGSWHYLDREVDKGPIIKRFKIPINQTDTAFSLNHKIYSLGIWHLNEVLNKVEMGFKGIMQSDKKGVFYINKFPSLENISDKDFLRKLTFFPPKHK